MIHGNGFLPASGNANTSTDKKAVTAQQGDDNAVRSESQTSSDKSIFHRAVSTSEKTSVLEASETSRLTTSSPEQTALDKMESPFKADDITIDDPEFKRPPGKIKKLALAIKIFSKSFKTIYQVNNPETDRSSLVETIRSKAYTLSSIVLNTLNIVLASSVTPALFVGALILCASVPEAGIALVLAVPVGIFIAIGVFAIGYMLSNKISNFITSAVSASVDTREKLTEITDLTLPKERFLKKYQRMEESLFALRTKLYAAELARINDYIKLYEKDGRTEKLKLEIEKREKLNTARVEAGIPDPVEAKWHESLQRSFLREEYGCDIVKLKDAIRKTEDWLNRAAKQKELLTDEHRELEELYDEDTQSITGRLEVAQENWVRV